MNKKEVIVHLETITPLWTGDAWQENSNVRPSSLMGSLRFWFEVICYFTGIVSEKEFDAKKGRFEKEVKQDEFKEKLKNIKNNGIDFKSQIKTLGKMDIPVPSIIFGTTGWKSLIEIKEIKSLEDSCFRNILNLPDRICVSKQNREIKEDNGCPKSSNDAWSVFYLAQPYFYGKLEIKFLVEEEIIDSIFYPLLNFMDKYGYWGGKWNIGYGRLRVIEVNQNNNSEDWRIEKFNFSSFRNETDKEFGLEKYLLQVNNFDELIQEQKVDKKIKIWYLIPCNQDDNSQNSVKDLKEVIKKLIKIKIKERSKDKNNGGDPEKRHKIFGTIEGPPYGDLLPQGSKILPYIAKEMAEGEEVYCGGFLSIVDMLKLYEGGEQNEKI